MFKANQYCPHCKEVVQKTQCSNCKHFYQHYVLTEHGYLATNAGHCCYPRLKDRKPTDYCDHWEYKETT